MSLDAMKQALEALEECIGYKTSPFMTRECEAAITALRAAIEQAQPNDRTRHKMMLAMIKNHWRSIDPQWKDDPELCHALGYEAGYKDAVAQRVEPRLSGSGAGFESLPASPKWQGLTDEEREQFRQWAHPDIIEAIELKLQQRNT